MFIAYPKMKTLYKLEHEGKKWTITKGELLPETAALHFLSTEDLVFTEKIDGTNMGVYVENGKVVHIQKRNGIVDPEEKTDQFYLEEGLIPTDFPEEFTGLIFGELHGVKIQKGGIYSDKREFRMFDILNPITHKFFTWDAVLAMSEILNIPTVPEVEYTGTLAMEDIKNFVKNQKVWCNQEAQAEGMVVRYRKDTTFEKRWVAKIRYKDFG